LLRQPTLSRSEIVFSFAGDLWSVSRRGGKAKRLTTGSGVKTGPIFSPDGTQLAFTGDYGGNQDVYVIPSAGGTPKRLTYHPGLDQALGWTPDGRRVLFRSTRATYANLAPTLQRFFTVGLRGEPVVELPLPMGQEAVFSPDGSHLAYVPLERKNDYFRRYRGGRTTPIWIARLSDSHIKAVPRDNSTDFNPMWVGDTVYFLSDRKGPATLFAYDVKRQRVSQVLENYGFDFTSASAGPGAIVYEQFGSLHLYHLASGTTEEVQVRIEGDFPELRSRLANVSDALRNARLSPKGNLAAFEARGEILVVDVGTGKAQNLTRSPGIRERDPAWAPDEKRIAYFSDESGEYALHLRPADGSDPVKIGLGEPPSFYYAPRWSPDGKKIAYIDKRQNIWWVDIREKTPVKVDAEVYFDYFRTFRPVTDLAPVWSPDGRWLVYSRHLPNRFAAIFLYSLHTGRTTQVTDDACDARNPVFDPDGKYLYFTAVTSSSEPNTSGVYSLLLEKDWPTPPTRGQKDSHQQTVPPAKHPLAIELDGISRGVRPLPVSAGNYVGLIAVSGGVLFLIDAGGASPFDPPNLIVRRLEMRTGTMTRYLRDVSSVSISADGKKMLYQQGGRWTVCSTATPPQTGEGTLPTKDLTVPVEPRAAWRQMYHEALRLMRDFFYDPGLHGVDLKAMRDRYRPYVDGLVRRQDLNALILQMLGDLSVSHAAIRGGDIPRPHPLPRGGLLGADYTIANGRYRFARVYAGDRMDAGMRAPLVQARAEVQVGEYLLAINGQALVAASDNIYRALEGTAGEPTVLRVGPEPDGAGAREVTVRPIPDELGLRQWDWIEGNRRRVLDATRGRVGYVYIPHTLSFERVKFALAAQDDKDAVIFDERFNVGGDLPTVLMEKLHLPFMVLGMGRGGPDQTHRPPIHGPKILLINEYAGSGGDALAWYFRRLGIGPVVGKRTWGGLTGAFGTPELMDGAELEIPSVAIWGTNGEWVENRGIAPDIEVEFDPERVRRGQDPQLEAAIKAALERLQKNPAHLPRRPAHPNAPRTEKQPL
jgi:tricorn protease